MQELERTGPTELAVMCQRVANNPRAYLAVAARAGVQAEVRMGKVTIVSEPK